MLKTTTHLLVGFVSAMITLSAVATACPLSHTATAWLGGAVLGQSSSGDASGSDREQAADLLRRARQAMAENRFDVADSLISKADALGVDYGTWFVGDTPRKARRDLERKRNDAVAEANKPSQLLAPLGLGGDQKSPSADPFARYSADSAGAPPLTPLPNVDANDRGASAPGNSRYPTTEPGENDVRAPGQYPAATNGTPPATPSPLRVARLALAVGDVRRAGQYVAAAKAMHLNYQPLDDTPEKVDAAIQKYQELLTLDKTTEAYARAYAHTMMEQADALARWSELDPAEQLALRAARLNIAYSPFEQKPQDLLDRIANLRRQGNGRAAAGGTASAGQNGGSSGRCRLCHGLVRSGR